MKIIIVMGPHGAGKDTVIQKLLEKFGISHPGVLTQARYTTTRPRRPDEEGLDTILFTSTENFNELLQKKKFVTYAAINNNKYFSGTTQDEFLKSPVVITNLPFSVTNLITTYFKDNNPEIFKIYIECPKDERRNRIKKRNPEITEKDLNHKLDFDVNVLNQNELSQVDVITQNLDGKLDDIINDLSSKVKKFIES